MTLEMKDACEKCGARLSMLAEAYMCSFECTFCPSCTLRMKHKCPNCAGELLRRPTREV